MTTAAPLLGIRHVALFVADLAAAERFWVDVMGYEVEWRPIPTTSTCTAARDNLALHRGEPAGAVASTTSASPSRRPADVDAWAAHLEARASPSRRRPRPTATARGRSTSAPEGLLVQIIHHTPMVGN